MNNIQETLLFPVRDAEARKQFLIACLVTFSGFIVPIIPFLILMGYGAKVTRQITDEKKSPSMPQWQGSDWSAMLLDGVRLYGAQLILILPFFLLMGFGVVSMMAGSTIISISADQSIRGLSSLGIVFLFIGILSMPLFVLVSLPYGIILSAVGPHVITKNSFAAAFQFKEWWQIFRKGLGQFILGYVMIMAASFIFTFVIQIALITIVLICIVPLIMIPYTAYLMLITNAVFAQAYVAGRDSLPTE